MIKLGERLTLEGVQGPNPYEPILTHLKQIESILELDLTLHLGSSNHELSFLAPFFFWSEPIDFPSKMMACKFSLDLPSFGLGPSSKGHGSKLWLSSNRTVLFHWTLNLGPSSKVAMSLNQWSYYFMKVLHLGETMLSH
jgi:hypothetical protein